MSTYGQRTKWRGNISENFNRLSRAHEHYRQRTDGLTTTYSERERSLKITDNNDETNLLPETLTRLREFNDSTDMIHVRGSLLWCSFRQLRLKSTVYVGMAINARVIRVCISMFVGAESNKMLLLTPTR